MANKFEFTKTYNEAIADASNNIGQKLFAYISKGKNINDRIREKFKKSLIFIGDEGQIYNPLTNTYVGIGQTAYTATISYIEDAHEKISTLSQMLASSMVSSIYANWKEEEWSYSSINTVLSSTDYDNAKPAKIYATNEIVLKGLGDYDPTTKLAATREYAHITDDNATDENLKKLYNNTYKEINKTEFVTYQYTNSTGDNITLKKEGEADLTVPANGSAESTVDYNVGEGITKETINKYSYAFATSGITVSLNKGLNKYLYTYTFTHKPEGENTEINANTCVEYVGEGESAEYFRKTINLYLTLDKLNDYKTAVTPINILDEDGKPLINANAFENGGKHFETPKLLWDAFWNGIEPVYEDGYTKLSEVDTDGNKSEANINTNLKHQLFKQSANILTIDDKLTWSYISSAYSYTVNFSKEYTDNQVNMIYRELLGEEAALIPASEEQVKVLVPNSAAELNSDRLVWNESTKTWTNGDNIDKVNESSSNLGKYVLDYSSTFVSRHLSSATLNADSINDIYDNKGELLHTVLPWQVLDDLAQAIAKAKQDASKSLTNEENSEEQIAEILFGAAANAITNFKPKFFNGSTYKYVSIDTTNNTIEFKDSEGEGITLREILKCTDKTGFDILENVRFMGYDRTLKSAHSTEEASSYERTAVFNSESAESGKYQRKSETSWYKYINTSDTNDTLTITIGASEINIDVPANSSVISEYNIDVTTKPNITKTTIDNYMYYGLEYKQPYLYKIIDQNDIENWVNNSSLYTDATPLFVVNTSHVGMDNINLADGIQTLKEVAYVLDIITDGWGNQYDPEGNGILLTYTIANNHERIEDHEQRLVALEGGKNVVRAIFKETDAMSKYVNLYISSDTSWILNSTITTGSLKTTVPTDELSKTWYAKNGSELTFVQNSYLYSYDLILKDYTDHLSTNHSSAEPSFTTLFGIEISDGFIEFSHTSGSESYFKKANGDLVTATPTYTGQVGLGIDLNVATSYSTSIYCDHTSDGYEVVDLNSNCITKTGILNITLPKEITYDEKVVRFTEPISNNGNYSTPYVNTTLRFTEDDIITLFNQLVSDATDESGLLRYYKSEIEEFLNNFDEIDGSNTKIRAKLETREYTGLNLSLNFVIDPTTCVDKSGYRTQLYVKVVDSIEAYNKPSYLTKNTSADPITVGETPNQITIAAGATVELNTDYSGTTGLTVTDTINSIPSSSNDVFYIRKDAQTVNYYNTDEDALTNVKWVSAYVSHTVENVKQSLKEIEFEAYQYSKNLISQLDGNFVASYSYYVAGLTQKDGKVTPIVRELPKDNITASTTVWGETTETAKQYEEVQNGDIDNEIAMVTPLFIKTVDYYEVPLNVNYAAEKYIDESNNNEFIKLYTIVDAEGNKDDEFAYQFNEGEYEYVSWLDVNDCLSSARIGRSYRRFRQLYFKRDGYVQIDGADLRKVGDEWRLLTGYIPGANEGDPDVPVYEETTFYKLANSGQPEAVKKYISAEVDYQSDYTDGVGGNNFKVTAHITKLSDASEDNSGLVDAYDVRNTLDNMFEWVDLSRWDEETASNPNPVNTKENEAGGGITAATRINDTKMKCAGTKANSLGYPINLDASESTEPTTPTPESGDTSGDESEPGEGS